MASYAVISSNTTAGTGDGSVLALVVTDGVRTDVFGDTPVAAGLREDIDWATGDEAAILTLGLTGLSYYTLDGPHRFEGDTKSAGPVLARTYGLG